jgi:hypothetical protein
VAKEWARPHVDWVRDPNDGTKIADCPYFTVPAFSQRAVSVLRDLLENDGEILPLNGLNGEYVAFHLLRKSVALDLLKSKFERNSVSGIITIIWSAVFRRRLIEGFSIFGVVGAVRSCVYVSEEFAARLRSAGLDGYRLTECEMS